MADKQNWQPVVLAALGIVGTLLAGSMQHLWTLREQRGQEFENRRREAYLTFLRAIDKPRLAARIEAEAFSLLMAARKEEEKDAERSRTQAGELRKRARDLREQFEQEAGAAMRLIAVYGDKEVVEAWAKYARALDRSTKGKEAYGPCSPAWQEDVAVYQAIRRSSLGPSQVVEEPSSLAISALLCDPKTSGQREAPAEAPQAAPP